MGRIEETNAALTELENNMTKTLDNITSKEIATAVTIAGVSTVNAEIAKSLAQLADDIHFLRETMAKEQEEVQKRSKQTCGNCRYSYVIDHIDRGLLTRFNVEFCHLRDAEVDFRFTPICNHFKPKEEETES